MSQTEEQTRTEVQNACLAALADGNRQLTMSRRYLLRALDETWIRAVEEVLPALDAVLRHPQRQLREKEKVLPIEFSRNITSRSVRHLTQHTNLIAKVEGDVITPSKILNVYSDETAKTYENKFVNTLLQRLYAFVQRRCDTVLERGLDAKVTTLEFDDAFSLGATRGKVHLTLEYEEKPEGGLAMGTDARYTDLWQRAQHIRSVTGAYLHSDFVQAVGQNYVRPPVIRTNAILKNKDLRGCLALWEFLDGYEEAGYTLLVDRQEGTLTDGAEADILAGVSALYLRFLDDMRDAAFAEPDPTAEEVPEGTAAEKKAPRQISPTDDALRERILREVQIALSADEQYRPAEEPQETENEETLSGRFRFRWSFLARLSQASDATRGYYAAVKEALLSYRKIGARVSWNYETFSFGRRRCARIAVHGKTLLLYLALAPDDFDRNRYHFTDASDVAAYRDVPLRLPIRSPRALKYALELISEMMNRLGAALLPEEKRRVGSFLPPFRSLGELLADRLIRPLTDTALPEDEAAGTTQEESDLPEDDVPPTTGDENAIDAVDAGDAEIAESADGNGLPLRGRSPYRYSFEARLSLGDEAMRAHYTALAEALTSYTGVRRRATWHYDAFYHGRGTCARIGVRGKTVFLYLALSPNDYNPAKYHFSDVSDVSLYRGTPMQLRVRSDRALRLACELIRTMLAGMGAAPLPADRRRAAPLTVVPRTRAELLAAGLIRIDGDAPPDIKTTEPLPAQEPETVTDATAETPVTAPVTAPVAGTETGTAADAGAEPTAAEPVTPTKEPVGTTDGAADGAPAAAEKPVTPVGDTPVSPAGKRGFFHRLFSRRGRRGNGSGR